MARVTVSPFRAPEFPSSKKKSPTRGLKARATRFANDVRTFCDWYFTGTNRRKRSEVNGYVEWLRDRSKQAGCTK